MQDVEVSVVQSLNRERDAMERYGAANAELRDAQHRTERLMSIVQPAVELVYATGMALVIYFGGAMVTGGTVEVGVLIAFTLYIQRFFEPLQNLALHYSGLQTAMASGARIFELLDTEPEVVDKPDAIEAPRIAGEVRYEGVGFHYTQGTPVLQDIDLHVRAGETVALVGPTGAGKTTMASLLLRLYDVTEGRVLIDGHDVRDVRRESLVHQMSIVAQEPFLFTGTVRENIRYNHVEATDDDIVRAARAVGAHQFVTELENGYDTELQERGRQPQHRPAAADQFRPRSGRQPAYSDP